MSIKRILKAAAIRFSSEYRSLIESSNRAVTRWNCSPPLLFICKGNICRSCYAEHKARSVFPDGTILFSAGLETTPGKPANTQAAKEAVRRGIDLTSHRTQSVSDDLVERAALILVMDLNNYHLLLERYPSAKEKSALLGVLSKGGAIIDDPFGRKDEEFIRCFDKIDSAIEALRKKFVP